MFRSIGGTSLTTRSPMRTSPAVASSRPAAIRSTVVFPDPDGPTSTTNSPSAISRLRSSTATVPPSNTFLRFRNSIFATSVPSTRPRRDQVAVPQRTSLRDPPLRREVDEDDPEPLVVAVLPFEVVQQRPDVVAAHVDTLRARALQRLDVAAGVSEPPLVLDHPDAVQL